MTTKQLYTVLRITIFFETLQSDRVLVIYVKSILNANQVSMDTNFKESVWCKVKLKYRDNLLIGCVYRSPNAYDDNFHELKLLFDKCNFSSPEPKAHR